MKVTTPEQLEELKAKLPSMQLCDIGNIIHTNWSRVYFGAVPYLEAICFLTDIKENYGLDDGKTIVIYFLSNATTWKGDVAREVKKELKRRAGIK